jgi:uncharacterized protein
MRASLTAFLVVLLLGPAPEGPAQDGPSQPSPSVEPRRGDPWSVPATWEVEETEVRFESDGAILAGTLHAPRGTRGGPAVVVVQQAGTATRDLPLFVQVAETFHAIGYSVFLYDRRGEGESEGAPGRPDYLTMARDAVAAKHAIAELPAVHPERIGFWGLSQSGWLAMEAGARSDPAFVISVGAPLTTPGEQMEFLTHNYVLLDGHGEAAARRAVEVRRMVLTAYFRGEVGYEEARAVLAAVEDEPWFHRAFLPAAQELPRDVEQSSWIREMAYDPVPAFQGVDAPLLFLLGGEDIDVPVARTLDIAAGLRGRDDREIVVIPGASHLMRLETDPRDQFTLQPGDVSDAPAYFLVMGEWLGRLGLGRDG